MKNHKPAAGEVRKKYTRTTHTRKTQALLLATAGVAGVFSRLSPAEAGMTFNNIYDPTVSGRADFPQVQAAMNYAELQFSSFFADNITINVTVSANASVGLGSSGAEPLTFVPN